MDNDKPTTLTGFTAKTQGEIDRHMFAAKTGGLVSLSAPAFWEMLSAATAWHEFARKMTNARANKAAEEQAGGEESARILQGARDVVSPLGPQARDTETSAQTAQARDTTPSEDA